MSEKLKCTNCDSELIDGAAFCAVCGKSCNQEVYEEPIKAECKKCGAILNTSQVFCHACGTKIAHKEKTCSTKATVYGWIGRSISLTVAILFVVFAFLPLVTCDVQGMHPYFTEDNGFEKTEIKVSPIDNIVFGVVSLQMLDDSEIIDSSLYERIELYVDEMDDLSRRDLSHLMKLLLRLVLKSEYTPITPQRILSTLVSLTYLLFSFAFLSVAIVDFVLFARGRRIKLLRKAVLIMLAALPVFLVFTAICTRFSIGYVAGASLTGSCTCILILSLMALAYFSVEYHFLGEAKTKVRPSAIVKRSLSSVACALLLFATLLPMATYSVKTEFDNSWNETRASRDLNADFFSAFILTEDQKDSMSEISSNTITNTAKSYQYVTAKLFKKGYANNIDASIILGAFALHDGKGFVFLISLITVLAITVSLCAAVLLWQNLAALVCDYSPRLSITLPAKILSVIASVLLLALVIVFVVVTDFNLDWLKTTASINLSIASGSITVIIASLLAALAPIGKKTN